jgi:L-asparagine transporter-like permease
MKRFLRPAALWPTRLVLWFLLAALIALFVPREQTEPLLGVCLVLAVLLEFGWWAAWRTRRPQPAR